jgi:hypothetical protein
MDELPRRLIFSVPALFLAGAASSPAMAEQACDYGGRAADPANRFADHGDGTVTDRETGLMWKRCSEGQTWDGNTCTGIASTHTWPQALALAEHARYAGKDDWRVPDIKELMSIVEHACHSPAIDLSIFPGTPGGWYWSSQPNTSCSGGAWCASFSYGDAGTDDEGSPNHVRLVSGGRE